jgi:hypothetical protein
MAFGTFRALEVASGTRSATDPSTQHPTDSAKDPEKQVVTSQANPEVPTVREGLN